MVAGGAARLGIKAVTVPPQADRVLSMLKYVVLAVILYFTYRTSELVFRGYDPCYALLSRHGEDITIWAYVIAGVLIVASVVLMLPFCRWLCPLAAVLNPFSRFGVTRIRRDVDACVECGECTVACPMAIPVDRLTEVRAARCTSCMSCIQECPGGAEGALSWGPAGRKRRHWPQGVLVALLLACTAGAVAANFALPLPSYVKTRGELSAATATVELRVAGLGCRGNASLLMYFLERDDLYELPGYLKLEAWPGPGAARTRITYDPTECDEDAIKEAITEPYHDQLEQRWRYSPFEIEGYDQLGRMTKARSTTLPAECQIPGGTVWRSQAVEQPTTAQLRWTVPPCCFQRGIACCGTRG